MWILALSTTCSRVVDTGSKSLFRGGVVATIARAAIASSLIMYPVASTVAFGFLNCEVVELASSILDSLDGGRSVAQLSSGDTGTTRVSVLHSNPYFACWAPGGAHTRIASFAIVVLILYSLGLPVLLYVRASRDPWLANALRTEMPSASGNKPLAQPSAAAGRIDRGSPGRSNGALRPPRYLFDASSPGDDVRPTLDPLAEGLVYVIYRPG